MLGFDGPMGQCFRKFPTVPQRSRGERGKEEERYEIGRVNPNSHIPHLQVQLAFARHNQLVCGRTDGPSSLSVNTFKQSLCVCGEGGGGV